MRAFTCDHCGQLLFFENSLCLRCHHPQGLVPSALDLVVLDETGNESLRRCENAALARCNWVVEDGDDDPLCRSCRLTQTRPSDTDPAGLEEFAVAEAAKRRLIFQLLELGLPGDRSERARLRPALQPTAARSRPVTPTV